MGNKIISGMWREVTVAVDEHLTSSRHTKKRKRQEKISTKGANKKRNRQFLPQEIDHISDYEFRKLFRMSRESFSKLLDKLDPFLYSPDVEMARRSSGSSISKKTKVYCTLRWLAGGSYLDLCLTFGVSRSSFFSYDHKKGIVWPVIEAIDAAFQIGLPVHDLALMRETELGFRRYTNGEMPGCISAIDGWVCKTRKPTKEEVGDVMAYRNRHGCWGLVVLAGCDSNCRFNIFSCKYSGSTNDCLAWDICDARDIVEGDDWPDEFYVIGDEAFLCTNNFLVPYSGRGIGVSKDSFNYLLSRMRQCIERSFALLVQRWGILWRPLEIEFSGWTKVLMAVAKLHNYCIDERDAPLRERHARDIRPNDVLDVIMNESYIDPDERDYIISRRAGTRRRNRFRYVLEAKGIVRPRHNMNSRA